MGGLPAARICAVVLLNSLCDIRQRQEHHSVSVLLASTAHRLPSSATPTSAHREQLSPVSHFGAAIYARANMCGHDCARKSWLYHRSVLLISALSRTPPTQLHTKSKVSYEVSCIELIVDSPEWLIALSNLQMTIANRSEKIYGRHTSVSACTPPPPPDHHSQGGSRQANLAGGNDMDSEIRLR